MTKRYFKATDGKLTYFRATATRAYQSVKLTKYGQSFSASQPGPGDLPTIEITKSEYEELVALKTERLKAADRGIYTSPSDSWVANSSLAE